MDDTAERTYHEDTEALFPPRVIPDLRSLRGDSWSELIDHILQLQSTEVERVAFVLLMTRLGGCVTCHANSFRAIRGCTLCAMQTVRRYRGSEKDLLEGFQEACQDVRKYLRLP